MLHEYAQTEGLDPKPFLHRYDLCDLLSHVYRQLRDGGYEGVTIHSIYRDEVRLCSLGGITWGGALIQ